MQKVHLLFIVLLLIFAGLQYRLWEGDGGIAHNRALEQEIAEQQRENARLHERNRTLEAEVLELKRGLETIEERARYQLGMVKDGETLLLLSE